MPLPVPRPNDGLSTSDDEGGLFVAFVADPSQLINQPAPRLNRCIAALERNRERTLRSSLGEGNIRWYVRRADEQLGMYRHALAAHLSELMRPPAVGLDPGIGAAAADNDIHRRLTR
jgi:hypothetical protein